MFRNWKWLRVGPMALVASSVALVLCLSDAHAGKTPPPPSRPVNYTWTPMPMPTEVTNLTATGMNNHGQVLASGYLWNSALPGAPTEVIDLYDAIMNDPDLEIIPSAELAGIWPKDTETGKFTMHWLTGTFELRFDRAMINDFGQGPTDRSPSLGRLPQGSGPGSPTSGTGSTPSDTRRRTSTRMAISNMPSSSTSVPPAREQAPTPQPSTREAMWSAARRALRWLQFSGFRTRRTPPRSIST